MRIIEIKMLEAIEACVVNWSLDNTSVHTIKGGVEVQLHGHRIATVNENGEVVVDTDTLKKWPTNTTKSRLRALGCNVYTKKGEIYLDDKKI